QLFSKIILFSYQNSKTFTNISTIKLDNNISSNSKTVYKIVLVKITLFFYHSQHYNGMEQMFRTTNKCPKSYFG
ncbi:hypothetical protein, partial [Enterococcus cecorum]|uniref:hypothetical protein n=1 Tax=Enterococcus cecorum TaxID=44008 RepID=UPI001FAC4B14